MIVLALYTSEAAYNGISYNLLKTMPSPRKAWEAALHSHMLSINSNQPTLSHQSMVNEQWRQRPFMSDKKVAKFQKCKSESLLSAIMYHAEKVTSAFINKNIQILKVKNKSFLSDIANYVWF